MQNEELPDIQQNRDTREVPINLVGISNVVVPITVLRRNGKPNSFTTVGAFKIGCHLDSKEKGTHMSRFTQVLADYAQTDGKVVSLTDLNNIAQELLAVLPSEYVRLSVGFDFFMEQVSPVSGLNGVAPLQACLSLIRAANGQSSQATSVAVVGKSCCPCSRLISDYDETSGKGKGAHAQRSLINMKVWHDLDQMIWIEDLVEIAWRSFSSPVYPILKRPDERHITMTAYDNPKFVEDIVRDCALQLKQESRILRYVVNVENQESIHYHNAFAEVAGLNEDYE